MLWGAGSAVIFTAGAFAAPILFVPAYIALGVQWGYGLKGKRKLEEAERLAAELASLQSRIDNDNKAIGRLELNTAGLVKSRTSFERLLVSAKCFTGSVEKCCAKLQTLERNYSEDQLKIADIVMKIRSTRLTTMDLDSADSREEVLRILRILCLELGHVAKQGQEKIHRNIHTRETLETRDVLLRLADRMDSLEKAQEADLVKAKAEAEAKGRAEAKEREEAKERSKAGVETEITAQIKAQAKTDFKMDVKVINKVETVSGRKKQARSRVAVKALEVNREVGPEANTEAKEGIREAIGEELKLEVKTHTRNDGPAHPPQLDEVKFGFETVKTDNIKPITGTLLRKAVGEMDKATGLKKGSSKTENTAGKTLLGFLIIIIAIGFLLHGIWNLVSFGFGVFSNVIVIGETSNLPSWHFKLPLPSFSDPIWDGFLVMIVALGVMFLGLKLGSAAASLCILGVSVGGLYMIATKGGLFTWGTIIFAISLNDAMKETKVLNRVVRIFGCLTTYFYFTSVLILWRMLAWALRWIF